MIRQMNGADGQSLVDAPPRAVSARDTRPWAGETAALRKPFLVPDNIGVELARFLENQIIYGVLPPGARLVEEDIVGRYKVSRSPVREAFRKLEHEGLAVRSPRRGVRVSELSLDDLNDLFATRLLLEGQAAENAAANRSAEQLAALREASETLQAQLKDGNARAFFAASLDCFDAVHAACGSRTLRRLIEHVGKQALRYRYLCFMRAPEMMDLTASSMASMTEAIARRDRAGAKLVMLMLLEQARECLRAIMASKDAPRRPHVQ